jgi:exodeoxyribonuclease VII large subunit
VQPRSFSVSEVTRHIKDKLETDERLRDLWVDGEISNWVRSRAGHCYFTLKDAQAAIRGVMWRSVVGQLSFAPQNGQAVRAHGYVSVYEPQGQYQLYVDALHSAGLGTLYLEYEALKAQLAAEGLFDAERKRSLPAMPECIGIVTSPTGAALRDILNVLRRRWPLLQVLVSPTLVQGERAPAQIVTALKALYERTDVAATPRVEVILVARGGGSIEDLWAFNDERVARAIAESPVPVVSGIGHEIDFTIADFCADVRAPTPSAAAEVAVPDQSEVSQRLSLLEARNEDLWLERLSAWRSLLGELQRSLSRLSPRGRLDRSRQLVDEMGRRADRAWRLRATVLRERVTGLENRLEALNPLSVLDRGYAVVQRPDGSIVRSVSQTQIGERIDVRVSDGRLGTHVEEVQPWSTEMEEAIG